MEELYELCDINLDEGSPLAAVQQALDKLTEGGETGAIEWVGCGPLWCFSREWLL